MNQQLRERLVAHLELMGQILALVPLVETKADTKKENQNLP